MTATAQQIHNLLIAETKRRLFDEGVVRIKKSLSLMTEQQIWHRPNASSNSAGNLVLHLCGNVRQWIVSGLGKVGDVRTRQAEFDEQGPVPVDEMLSRLDALMQEVEAVLDRLSSDDLVAMHRVQGYDESGLSILVHVVEHFSYHVGQITYIVKALNDLDVGYYEGQELNNPKK
jgi:uncharacterized damage-inducible protein DinB